jgi:hypothetical protein
MCCFFIFFNKKYFYVYNIYIHIYNIIMDLQISTKTIALFIIIFIGILEILGDMLFKYWSKGKPEVNNYI